MMAIYGAPVGPVEAIDAAVTPDAADAAQDQTSPRRDARTPTVRESSMMIRYGAPPPPWDETV
jgi:hypothetical protein